ncbi:nucleolar protein 6-like [Lycorma delicatula]|uniref:nucleolar protein 6-like n=1 Tax=Lycorma delicatula TaxID=130591 RepID=UPI003F50F291
MLIRSKRSYRMKILSYFKTVIQLGHSSRWPANVEAIRRIHAAFVIEIAKALKEQCNLLTQVFPDHVRIFKVS